MNELEDLLQKGPDVAKRLLFNGKFETARELYANLFKFKPENLQYRNDMFTAMILLSPNNHDYEKGELKFNYDVEQGKTVLRNTIKDYSAAEIEALFHAAFKNKKYYEGTIILEKFLEINPRSPEMTYNIGRCYQNMNMFDKAVEYFSKVDHSKFNNDAKWHLAGSMAWSLNKMWDVNKDPKLFEMAEKYYIGALSFEKPATDHENLLSQLGSMYYFANKNLEAIFYLSKALEIDPKNVISLSNIAMSYSNIAEDETALKYLEQANELRPNDKKIINNFGVIYSYLEGFDKAIEFYKKALEIDPKDYELYSAIGHAFSRLSKHEEAEKWLTEAKKKIPNNAYNEYVWAMHLKHKGLYEESLKHHIYSMGLDEHKRWLEGHFKSIVHNLSEIKNIHLGIRAVKKAFEETNDYSNLGVFVSALLLYAGESIRTKSIADDIFDLLSKDPHTKKEDQYYDHSDISKHDVLMSKFNKQYNIGAFDFIIKTVPIEDSEKLNKEYVVNSFLANILKVPKPVIKESRNKYTGEVAYPIVFIKGTDKSIYVQHRVSAPGMNNMLKINSLDIQKTLDNIAKIHVHSSLTTANAPLVTINLADGQNNLLETTIQKYDYTKELKRRFISRVPSKNKSLLENYFQNPNLNIICHTDFYTHNVLSGGIIVDFETVALSHPALDVAQFLSEFTLNDEEFVNFYVSQFNKHAAENEFNVRFDLPEFMKQYTVSKIHSDICQIGSKYNKSGIADLDSHIERLVNTKHPIRKYIVEYFNDSEIDFFRNVFSE